MIEIEEEWRQTHVGRLLLEAVTHFEGRVLELLEDAGYAKVRLSHFVLTRNLDRSGTRVTELAHRTNMSKQGMSELIGQCEAIGLVTRSPDPKDGRARIVRFTPEGLEWYEASRTAIQQAELEMRTGLGTLCVDGLRTALRTYITQCSNRASNP